MKDMDYYRSRGAYNRSDWLENQSKMVEIKKKYLRQMPVKTSLRLSEKEQKNTMLKTVIARMTLSQICTLTWLTSENGLTQ